MASDFYQTLGVDKTASQDDIKKAYRKLAHKFHPDKENGDEEKFKEVNEAYQVLGDDKKRAQYDQFGSTFDGAGGPGYGAGGFGGGFEGFNINVDDLGGMGDIFEQFFGGGGRTRSRTGPRTRRGDDVQIDTAITFQEAAQGIKKDISTRLHQACSRCRGNGAEPGTPITDCSTCNGSGQVTQSRQTPLGVFTQASVCPTCHGDGKQAEKKCEQCKGEGRELKSQDLSIDIPAGIADGQTIRLAGKGEIPRGGGMAGDLYLTVHVENKTGLERRGNNVHTSINLSFVDAALGTKVTVPTIEGGEQIDIPAGTQPGHEIRLSGKGFPSLRGGATGDQIVTINVEIPKKLNKKQRELLEEFKNTKKKRGLFS